MKHVIDVIFDGQVLRPAEALDLEPNGCYRVTIESPDEGAPEVTQPHTLLQRIAANARDLDLPPDFAEQIDHYLHGTPKR